jgi:hypothetical protein
MALEDDIHTLIRLAREQPQRAAEEIGAAGTEAAVMTMVGWLNGVEDALVLLAREIEQLKAGRTPGNSED